MRSSVAALVIAFGAAACGDDDAAPTPDAGADTAAPIDGGAGRDSGTGRDSGPGSDAGSGCLHPSFSGGPELDSVSAPLDVYCSARPCPPDFATARAEVADLIACDGGANTCWCMCLVSITSGCGVDTIETSCGTGASQMNFDHDTGVLIGIANRNDHLLGSPPCQFIETHAGRGKPQCPGATIETPCPSD